MDLPRSRVASWCSRRAVPPLPSRPPPLRPPPGRHRRPPFQRERRLVSRAVGHDDHGRPRTRRPTTQHSRAPLPPRLTPTPQRKPAPVTTHRTRKARPARRRAPNPRPPTPAAPAPPTEPAAEALPDDGCSADNSPTEPDVADGPLPAIDVRAASVDNPLPDLAVRRINCAGGWVNLKNEIPAELPLLVWFWAPH